MRAELDAPPAESAAETRLRRATDLSKLNSALAERLTEGDAIDVGDEVDIHLGEL